MAAENSTRSNDNFAIVTTREFGGVSPGLRMLFQVFDNSRESLLIINWRT
jgi:hypothetical protein